MSLPGLTGRSSTPGRWLLDLPVKPGDDSESVSRTQTPIAAGKSVPSTTALANGGRLRARGPAAQDLRHPVADRLARQGDIVDAAVLGTAIGQCLDVKL